jgi:hypothetical protein
MHCPKCGQQQISDEIRYCSRCGFLLAAVSAVVANNGELPAGATSIAKRDSPKKRGIKQGAFIFFLAFLFIPLLAMFHIATGTEPFLVAVGLILFVGGALLRIVWALLFESGEPAAAREIGAASASRRFFGRKASTPELPGSQSIPAEVYTAPETGAWRNTNDLSTPASVTDSTTKLLSKEKGDQ